MMIFHTRKADWKTDNQALRNIRTKVFVEEQHVPAELEWDDKDDTAHHWLAVDDHNNPLGTIRILHDGHIGRMAVLKEARNLGAGTALLQAAIEHARSLNLFEIYLYAQIHAQAFYEKSNFKRYGEEFMDADIPHCTMRLQLSDKRLLSIHGGDFKIENLRQSTEQLIEQTSQTLRILSFDLDPTNFDNNTTTNLLSILARKSRYSDIRLLVADTSAIVKRGHRWIELQRRLSSKIRIKRVNCEPHLLQHNLIIADQTGFICQSIKDNQNMWGNFNNLPMATNHISQFDELWSRAVTDVDLRQLDL